MLNKQTLGLFVGYDVGSIIQKMREHLKDTESKNWSWWIDGEKQISLYVTNRNRLVVTEYSSVGLKLFFFPSKCSCCLRLVLQCRCSVDKTMELQFLGTVGRLFSVRTSVCRFKGRLKASHYLLLKRMTRIIFKGVFLLANKALFLFLS